MSSQQPQARAGIVLGAGAVGMCAALSLQERGYTVTVADPGDLQRQASWGNAGRIAVETARSPASLTALCSLPAALFLFGGPVSLPFRAITKWLPFGMRLMAAAAPRRVARGSVLLNQLLMQALPAWRRRLGAIGVERLLVESGHYHVWEHVGSARRARESLQRTRSAGGPIELTADELERLRARLHSTVAGALKYPGTAQIVDLPELLLAMRTAFAARGGSFLAAELRVEEAERSADLVVIAAGVDSAKLLAPLGHTVPIIAERGYHISQPRADWPADLPPIHFEDRSIVVTHFASGLRATSFAEFSSREAPPDTRKWARLRRHVMELGLPFDENATEWVGSRPTLPDYLPAIGRSRLHSKVLYSFGHQHLGLTLAAISGELVAALADGGPQGIDMTPFNIDRF